MKRGKRTKTIQLYYLLYQEVQRQVTPVAVIRWRRTVCNFTNTGQVRVIEQVLASARVGSNQQQGLPLRLMGLDEACGIVRPHMLTYVARRPSLGRL